MCVGHRLRRNGLSEYPPSTESPVYQWAFSNSFYLSSQAFLDHLLSATVNLKCNGRPMHAPPLWLWLTASWAWAMWFGRRSTFTFGLWYKHSLSRWKAGYGTRPSKTSIYGNGMIAWRWMVVKSQGLDRCVVPIVLFEPPPLSPHFALDSCIVFMFDVL
jgi:hypothetical protein